MTRKEFELIARAVKIARPHHDSGTVLTRIHENIALDRAAYYLADTLSDTNAQFDIARFVAACGVEGDN